ncbi:DHA2 family efflux MFS transporter permease subunit [Spirillospora sp. NPDC029432]|uniref:MDR family MFS transporter n=1 Tax=Spirillospora sp. NPDC029432 TaxID=3154599 RepID=UPI003453133D
MTRGRYRWALAVVAVSAFMITMDNTVVTNALPTIIRELGLSNAAKDWVATAYILMYSCLMIAGGRLTDIYGCRVTFTTGMVLFTAASAVCGLAPDDSVLILGRVVQGAGAALAMPATLVMVTVGRTDKQRSLGTIVWVGAAGGATALGPTIGGIIVTHWHWGWIFLINVPVGILVICLGTVVLTSKGENRDARVDFPGVLISATMVFALAYGLESGRQLGWADPAVLAVFALSAIALLCFVVVESWAPDPMMNLRFFRNRVFVGGLLSQMMWGIGFNGMIFYSATFLQRYLGFSPTESGLVMLPSAIAVMVMTPVSFWLASRLGPRIAIGGGMAAMAFGMVLFSLLRQDDGFAELMPGVLIVGVGSAMCMPLAMYVLKAVPEQQAGLASGILNVIREVSGAFGIAIVGLLIHEIPPEGADAAALESFRHGTASGLVLGASLVLLGGVISALTLPSRRGWLGPKHGRHSIVTPRPAPAPSREPVPVGAPTGPPASELTAGGPGLASPGPAAADLPAPRPATAGPSWPDLAPPGDAKGSASAGSWFDKGQPPGPVGGSARDPLGGRGPDVRPPKAVVKPPPSPRDTAGDEGFPTFPPVERDGHTPRDGLAVIADGPVHTAPARYPAHPGAGDGGAGTEWPPPPPSGWYRPYVPEEDDGEARPPRRDAW